MIFLWTKCNNIQNRNWKQFVSVISHQTKPAHQALSVPSHHLDVVQYFPCVLWSLEVFCKHNLRFSTEYAKEASHSFSPVVASWTLFLGKLRTLSRMYKFSENLCWHCLAARILCMSGRKACRDAESWKPSFSICTNLPTYMYLKKKKIFEKIF